MKALVRALFLGLLALEIFIWSGMAFQSIQPDFSWLGLVLTALAAFLFVLWARMSWQIDFIVLGTVLLDAFSDSFNMYSRVNGWDTLLHFWGGAVVAIIAIYLLRRAVANGRLKFSNETIGILIGTVCIVAFFGTLYELQEYTTDLYYLRYQKQLGDGPDTVTDLVMNILGGAVVAEIYALILATGRRQPAPPPMPPRRKKPAERRRVAQKRVSVRRTAGGPGTVDLRSA